MKSALHQMMAPLAVLLGLILSVANSAHGSAHGRDFISSTAAVASQGNSRTPTIGLSLGFTMADFTGDTHPDLASVELKGLDSVSAQYMIVVRLSEGGYQFLQLTAPFGGLVITPKDVTGDGKLDLIIRAAGSRALVAVFVNDGFGHFSSAAPAKFSRALREAPYELGRTTDQTYFSATLISSKSYTAECQNRSARNRQHQDGSLFSANGDAPFDLFLAFGQSRAPPAAA